MKILLPCLLIILFACSEAKYKADEIQPYTGPVSTSQNVDLIFSDSAKKTLHIQGAEHWQLQNQDEVIKDSLYIEFFDDHELVESTLSGDSAYYEKKRNLWTITGEVELQNLKKGETLKTQLLYWSPDENRIFTDKNVVITTPDQVLHGKGLEAKDDFSEYEILHPSGETYFN